MKTITLVLMAALAAAAQIPAPQKPQPVQASQASELAILKAENALYKITSKEKDLTVEYAKSVQEQRNLNDQYGQVAATQPAAEKAVNEAIEQAWKDSGLDKTKYDFDPAKFLFTPKPEPKK